MLKVAEHSRYTVNKAKFANFPKLHPLFFSNLVISFLNSTAASIGSAADIIADTTARPLAPAFKISPALPLLIPPMATEGNFEMAVICFTPANPRPIVNSGLVPVKNTGEIPI